MGPFLQLPGRSEVVTGEGIVDSQIPTKHGRD